MAAIGYAALHHWFPPFFVQSEGGTVVRQFVLVSAIGMLLGSAMLLHTVRFGQSSFARWYGMALTSMGIGLFGVLLQTSVGTAVGWAGRSAQWLSGLYMMLAAFAVANESGSWGVPLAVRPNDPRLRYAMAVTFAVAATVVRLLFLHGMGERAVTLTFYPAVILAALYGGRGPGLVAALLSAALIDYFYLEPLYRFTLGELSDWVMMAVFLVCSVLIIWITESMRTALARAAAVEAEVAHAAERRKAVEALSASQKRFQDLVESIGEFIWEMDAQGRYTYCSPQIETLWASKRRK